MKLTSLLRQARFAVIALLFICIALIAVNVWRAPQAQSQDDQQQFYARVRNGVGSEIRLPAQGDSASAIQASVDSAASFIYTRAGVALTDSVKARLANMEASTLGGTSRRLSPDELSDILAEVALERLSSATDAEIDYAAETLRGLNAPDLPASFRSGRDYIRVRSDRVEDLTPEQFIGQVKKIKEADPISSKLYRGAAKSVAAQEIGSRISFLSEAVPEQFGTTKQSLTPLQALLIIYSAVSEDLLCDSEAGLRQRMQTIRSGIMNLINASYPNPDAYRAYGSNGYIFSTPLDLLFNEQTMNSLLDRIDERSVNP